METTAGTAHRKFGNEITMNKLCANADAAFLRPLAPVSRRQAAAPRHALSQLRHHVTRFACAPARAARITPQLVGAAPHRRPRRFTPSRFTDDVRIAPAT